MLLAWCFLASVAWKDEGGAKGRFARFSAWFFYLLLLARFLFRVIEETRRREHLWWNGTLIALVLAAFLYRFIRNQRQRQQGAPPAS